MSVTVDSTNREKPTPIIASAVSLWKQACSLSVTAKRLRARSSKLVEWAEEGLIPPWAVGESSIPPHFILYDIDSNKQILGSMLVNQGKQFLYELACSHDLSAKAKEDQAQALLQSVKTLYDSDDRGFHQAVDQITDYCKKERESTIRSMDRQTAMLRAMNICAETIFELRCSTPEPDNSGRINTPTPSRGGGEPPELESIQEEATFQL